MIEPRDKEVAESYCLICTELIVYDFKCKKGCQNNGTDISQRPLHETGTAYYTFVRCERWDKP